MAAGGVVLLAGVLYGIAYLVAGSGVPRHISVSGVSIGGLSPSAAEAKLRASLAAKATAPIAVLVGSQQSSVDPVKAGLTLDAKATVAAAGGRSANPIDLVKSLFGHRSVAPAVSVDTAKLSAAIDTLDASVSGGGHDGGIKFDGITPVAIAPVKGEGIVKDKAMAALRAAYLTSSEPVKLPMAQVDPAISAAAVQHAIDTIAKPAVAAPVLLSVGSTSVPVSPEVIAKNLTFKPQGHDLVPVVDGAGIAASLGNALAPLKTPGKDASFDLSSGTPVIVPSVPGTTADVEKLGPAIAGVLPQTTGRTVTVPTTAVQPSFTTEAAQALGIKEKVSTFTTYHPCCAARVTNIHKMADIVNGHVVMPGDTFSINGFVGERDRARGFVPAPMIEDGLYIDSVGGGVSQFATTLFN
ncbi:MAG TPA: VanW family protein, partial [Acidimicrobiales bacterium]|nr:VanW family protein [Acidimicrobiales bacterium]